jgi:hypothetical protein
VVRPVQRCTILLQVKVMTVMIGVVNLLVLYLTMIRSILFNIYGGYIPRLICAFKFWLLYYKLDNKYLSHILGAVQYFGLSLFHYSLQLYHKSHCRLTSLQLVYSSIVFSYIQTAVCSYVVMYITIIYITYYRF